MKLSIVDQSPIPAGFAASDAFDNTIDLARFAERLGYTRYWIAEHHSTQSLASPAPEIMIARVGAETERIRVGSGAVLLSHYSPMKVAETFRVLEALYPGRIDLGIGRAPGGSSLDAYALQHSRLNQELADDFPQRLVEMLAFFRGSFPQQHPFARLHLSPGTPGNPDVWLLGSSGWSADASAQLGLPYAAAHFIGPAATRKSVEHYMAKFEPSEYLNEPQVLVCVGAVAADTDEEAERLYSSQRLRRALRDQGREMNGPIPTPEEALAQLAELRPLPRAEEGEWPRIIVGSVEHVHERLAHMADELHVDELMLITVVHDHEARKHSYELLADAFEIEAPEADAVRL
jgi:luciferase family oxidoreductase group 1